MRSENIPPRFANRFTPTERESDLVVRLRRELAVAEQANRTLTIENARLRAGLAPAKGKRLTRKEKASNSTTT